MTSPAIAAITGALVFALGGAFLIGSPLEPDRAAAPAAEQADAGHPAAFSAKYAHDTILVRPGSSERLPDGTRQNVGGVYQWRVVEPATDPRLQGDVFYHTNRDEYGTGDATRSRVSHVMLGIANDEGSWRSLPVVHGQVGAGSAAWPIALVGAGGYDGLVAVGAMTRNQSSGLWELSGVVYEGNLPPMPEPYQPE